MYKKKVKLVKHCPCCGGRPTIRHTRDQEDSIAEIECNKCGLKMEALHSFNCWLAEKVAIKKWNKRLKDALSSGYDADKIREDEGE